MCIDASICCGLVVGWRRTSKSDPSDLLRSTRRCPAMFRLEACPKPTSYHLDSADLPRHGSYGDRRPEDRSFWWQIATAGSYCWTLRVQEGKKLLVYSTTRSMKAGYHGHCITTFIGWMLLNGFSSEWLQQYISVCTAWLRRTWLNCVRLPLRQEVVVAVFGPSQPATWSYHAADCAFSVAGLICWNAIPDYLKSTDLSFVCFSTPAKTFYFVDTDGSALESLVDAHALYKCILNWTKLDNKLYGKCTTNRTSGVWV